MKKELRKILEETYGGIENFVIKKPNGNVVFSLSYSDVLNLGDYKSSPFFICPNDEQPELEPIQFTSEQVKNFCPYFEGDQLLLNGMFAPMYGGIVISGILFNDLVLEYTVDSLDPENEVHDNNLIASDVKHLYTSGPVTAFTDYNGVEEIKAYLNNLFKYINGESDSLDCNELSKFVFEELKFKYKAI